MLKISNSLGDIVYIQSLMVILEFSDFKENTMKQVMKYSDIVVSA